MASSRDNLEPSLNAIALVLSLSLLTRLIMILGKSSINLPEVVSFGT